MFLYLDSSARDAHQDGCGHGDKPVLWLLHQARADSKAAGKCFPCEATGSRGCESVAVWGTQDNKITKSHSGFITETAVKILRDNGFSPVNR